MRRFGTVTLMLFAFVVGFASTYSCGGGGSSAGAAGDADTLQGYSALDFAFSSHDHAEVEVLYGAMCRLYRLTGFSPPGNVDCDPYQKTVFITSTTHLGNLGGLSGADAICQNAASNGGLAGTYMAWLSSSSQSPNDTFNKYEYPYVLPNGEMIASDWTDLTDGRLLSFLNIDEYGNTVSAVASRTNTATDGTANSLVDNCMDWTGNSGTQFTGTGFNSFTDSRWTIANPSACSSAVHLYCFEQ